MIDIEREFFRIVDSLSSLDLTISVVYFGLLEKRKLILEREVKHMNSKYNGIDVIWVEERSHIGVGVKPLKNLEESA